MVHGGRNNVLENNIIAQCNVGILFSNALSSRPENWQMRDFHRGNRLRYNVIYNNTKSNDVFLIAIQNYTGFLLGESNHQLFYMPNGEYKVAVMDKEDVCDLEMRKKNAISLNEWQALGYDKESLITNPLFVNPEGDDYRLQQNSPLFKLGFLQFDPGMISRN